MMSQQPNRRRAAQASLIGGYLNIGVVVVQGLLLVPLYLKYVGPSLYGAWLGSGDILGWLAVIDMGLASLMVQRIGAAYGRNDRKLVSQYLTTGLLTQVVLVLLLLSGAIVVSKWVPTWMNVRGNDASTLSGSMVLAGAANGLGILNNGVSGFAKALQRTVFLNTVALIGALFGIGVTVSLLLMGWGLWAIPLGLVTRNGIPLLANTLYAALIYRSEVRMRLELSREVLRDLAKVSPAMFLGKLGSAFMGRSEAALISIFIRPELATVYVLTRRAADIIRLMLDRFGAATFPGFSHLIGADQRARAVEVYKEIMNLFVPVAVLLISLYLAANKTFMSLWVGSDLYGGSLLTTLIGFSVLVTTSANLINYLYGATGQITRSSLIMFVEGVLRLGLMGLLLWGIGISGLPIAAIMTGTVASLITLRWTGLELNSEIPGQDMISKEVVAYVGLVVLGAILGSRVWAETWLGLTLLGALTATTYLGFVMYISPILRRYFRGAVRQVT